MKDLNDYQRRQQDDRELAIAQLRHVIEAGIPMDITMKIRHRLGQDHLVERVQEPVEPVNEVDTKVSVKYHDEIVAGWNQLKVKLLEEIKDLQEELNSVKADHSKAVGIVFKLEEKNKELTTLLDSATTPDTSELEEIDKAAAENFHPKTGMPLDSDEIPYLKCRSPLLRKVGCALQKNEVWQVRRYIQSGRSPAWICDKMGIGESTVSGIKHNKTYAGVPLEHPKECTHTKPVKVRAGYGVEKQSGKKG